MEQVSIEVKDFIKENYMLEDDEVSKISFETSLLETGVIDSTGVMELVDFIETKYSLTIETDEIIPENLDSLKNITTFISNKRQ